MFEVYISKLHNSNSNLIVLMLLYFAVLSLKFKSNEVDSFLPGVKRSSFCISKDVIPFFILIFRVFYKN